VADLGDPHVLRTTFDDSPELYDRTRPVAPPELFDDLVELARLRPECRVLEVGCGTGQATLPLAERGLDVIGIELGENLAELARRKLARFARLRIVTSSFEDWDPGGEHFDAVVSVNAFHWIEPRVRFTKSASVLREGGALAVVELHYVTPDDADDVYVALQEDYDAVLGPGARQEAPPHPDVCPSRAREFEASGCFRNVVERRYLWNIRFGADEYVDLLRTSSWHRKLDEDVRRRLLERIHRRIEAHPAQTVRPTLLGMLYVAERS
jgi:SAM-dependent methyltransferase